MYCPPSTRTCRWSEEALPVVPAAAASNSLACMIIVAGQLHLDPAQRDAYLEATAAVAVKARGSHGCLDFVQAADPIDPGRINVYERWASDADLEAFRASGPEGEPDDVPELGDAEVRRYRISAVEDAGPRPAVSPEPTIDPEGLTAARGGIFSS